MGVPTAFLFGELGWGLGVLEGLGAVGGWGLGWGVGAGRAGVGLEMAGDCQQGLGLKLRVWGIQRKQRQAISINSFLRI